MKSQAILYATFSRTWSNLDVTTPNSMITLIWKVNLFQSVPRAFDYLAVLLVHKVDDVRNRDHTTHLSPNYVATVAIESLIVPVVSMIFFKTRNCI